ncbi:phosphate transport system regulatory protein PhoU, partial [bacterium]
MERHLDQELTDLKQQLLKMGTLVEAAIFESMESLKELSIERVNKIISEGRVIDEMENAIDEQCL